jgi:hypothetical protein
MNRIVLIGNGFDIAHGYNTTYEDFIVWYFKKHIAESENGYRSLETKLIKISWIQRGHIQGKKFSETFNTISELKSNFHIGINFSQGKSIRIDLKSLYFEELLHEKKWTDIESYYFNQLVEIHKRSNNEEEITALNDFLSNLQFELTDYLSCLTKDKVICEFPFLDLLNEINTPHDHNTFMSLYPENIELNAHLVDSKRNIENVVFVNFNYTPILKQYFSNLNYAAYLISIHGDLSDPKSIIFGYGDEHHEKYPEIERKGTNIWLEKMKSFHYFSDKNYSQLMNTLSLKEFEVFVIGHSLGLSDRLLLNTIFEHENCLKIKLFHRGSNEDQFQKRISLSRHFQNKGVLRQRLMDFSESDVFNSK